MIYAQAAMLPAVQKHKPMLSFVWICSLASATALLPQVVHAESGMFAPTVVPYVAPGKTFAIKIPSGWSLASATAGRAGQEVTFRSTRGAGDAFLSVRSFPTPHTVDPQQLLLRAVEDRLNRLDQFREQQRRKLRLGGMPAASVTGSFNFQGNAQFPRAIEEVFAARAGRAYVLHFECFAPDAQKLAVDVAIMYSSFVPGA